MVVEGTVVKETVRLGALTTIAMENLHGWNLVLPGDRETVYMILENAGVRTPNQTRAVLSGLFAAANS